MLEKTYKNLLDVYLQNNDYKILKNYIAHGDITVYEHSLNVANKAHNLVNKWHLKVNEEELIQACLLHDFYLYDWHKIKESKNLFKMHGFVHPKIACDNAIKYFGIDETVQKAIKAHMWPLNLFTLPTSKIALILCIVDKIVATKESIKR